MQIILLLRTFSQLYWTLFVDMTPFIAVFAQQRWAVWSPMGQTKAIAAMTGEISCVLFWVFRILCCVT